MKTMHIWTFLRVVGGMAGILAMAGCSASNEPRKPDPQAEKAATAKALERFDEMKFGMFIHWGLYTIPAGEWKGKYVRGMAQLCTAVCSDCEQACRKHAEHHTVCRTCADACAAVVAAAKPFV